MEKFYKLAIVLFALIVNSNLSAEISNVTTSGFVYTVDRIGDNASDGNGQTGTLRYCIVAANSHVGDDVINIQNSITTITIDSVLPTLVTTNGALTINGGDGVTIQVSTPGAGGSPFRVFFMAGAERPVSLTNLEIKGGDISGVVSTANSTNYGGSVFIESGTLTIDFCTITGSKAYSGGGIFNYATLTLLNSTVSGNIALHHGGGIYNYESSATITGCNYTGNTAKDYGGGIYNYKTSSTINNCTFSDNEVLNSGGGIGTFAASPTITDCEFTGNTARYNGGGIFNKEASPTISNCRFTNNSVDVDGGGISNYDHSSPIILNCTFTDNSSENDGGGMSNYNYSSPTITNSSFASNAAENDGGGIYNHQRSSPIISSCVFTENTAGYSGGGVDNYYYSSPAISDCTFTSDSAFNGGGISNSSSSSPTVASCTFINNFADFNGGGIDNTYSSSSQTISDCQFINNSANSGGGINNYGSSPPVTNCIFTGNTADWEGGGICNDNFSSSKLLNCVFTENKAGQRGGAIYNEYISSGALTNCTLADNTADDGGGIYNGRYSNPTIINSIIWGNSAATHPQIYNSTSNPHISYTDIEGGFAGTGNIDSDPIFVGSGDFPYLINEDSPCIDAGDNSANSESYDIRGVGFPRKMDGINGAVGTIDIGAYEVQSVNDPPDLTDDKLIAWENMSATIDVLANDSDIDNGQWRVFIATSPVSGGSVWVIGSKITYSSPAGFSGADEFEYEVCDNGAPIICRKAKVYVTVNPVNDLPIVDDEINVLDEDGFTSGDFTDIGDYDPEGTDLLVTSTPLVAPENGTFEVLADGLYTYVPNPNFYGADLVVVEVCDQGLPVKACVPDSLLITVNSINDAPVALSKSVTVKEDAPNVLIDITDNISDVDNDLLTITILSGAATVTSPLVLGYNPPMNFNGPDEVVYVVCDETTCDTGIVHITVTPVNDPPVLISTLEDIKIQVGEKHSLLLTNQLELVFDDVDEGDVLTPSVVMASGLPMQPWVTIKNGWMLSVPYGGNMGCFSFVFIATDLAGATATDTFDICVVNNNVATGIVDMNEAFGVSLYPNPSTGKVNVELLNTTPKESSVSVYNIAGQQIRLHRLFENRLQLNLENEVSGIYFIKIITGSKQVVKKLVLRQ